MELCRHLAIPALVAAALCGSRPILAFAGEQDGWRRQPLPRIRVAPDPERISILPEKDGEASIVGSLGAAVDPHARLVRAVNLRTADQAAAIVRRDGSFRMRLMAPPGSDVQVFTSMLEDFPEGVRRRLGNDSGLEVTRLPEHVRGMIETDRTSSPGVILPVASKPASQGRSGFVIKIGPARWVFGHAEVLPARLTPGRSCSIRVTLHVRFETEAATGRADLRPPRVHPQLLPLFDKSGRQRSGVRIVATHVLTPTGLPIETHVDMVGRRDPQGEVRIEPGGQGVGLPARTVESDQWRVNGRVATITQFLRAEIPARVPTGVYALVGHLEGLQRDVAFEQAVMNEVTLGRMTVGTPAQPRLACLLLGSDGTGGARGAIAREDRGNYSIAPRNVLLPEKLIIPRDDPRTGKPLVYPLDPYLPLVARTDRPHEARLWPPRIRFGIRPGHLTVTVRRPDGKTDRLGPAPLVAGQNDLSALCPDRVVRDRIVAPVGMAYGNPSLADIYHLTGRGAFDYAFEQYGHYVVRLDGTVRDLTGAPHVLSGTYDVYVARPLDLAVFPEPGTPLQPDKAIRPQVRVLPAMPAEVEMCFLHLPGSDPAKAVRRRIAGRANRWGVFVPAEPNAAVAFGQPGEYRCDVTARCVDSSGTWWMASRRGASVVVTPNSPVVIHGERGNRAPTMRWRARWFIARDSRFVTGTGREGFDMGHTCLPYEPGDVAWLGHRDPDSLFPGVTFEDPGRTIGRLLEQRWPAVRNGAGREGLYPRRLLPEDRQAIGEMPFVSSSSVDLPPSMAPEAVDQWGYYYATTWRPGVSVRSHVAEDLLPAGYWFFDDVYGYQFGVGPQGDLPGDFKMNYAGTVFRDRASGTKHYGAYASALMIIDPTRDTRGRRVLPPFDGLVPGSPRSGPLLEAGGKRYGVFLTFGPIAPGAAMEVGDRLAVAGVVWPPVSGFVEGEVTDPDGEKTPFRAPSDAMGLFSFNGPVADRPGLWKIAATGICNGATSVGRIADLVPKAKWPRGGGVGLEDNSFVVPVTPPRAESIAFDIPLGARASPPEPLVLHGHVPAVARAKQVGYLVSLPGQVIDQGTLPAADGSFVYVYDPSKLARRFPNIDVELPHPDPAGRRPAWYDTVTFTFWAGKGADVRAGMLLLQGEDVYATAASRLRGPRASRPLVRRQRRPVALPRKSAERSLPFARTRGQDAPAYMPRTALLALSSDGRDLFAAHPWSGQVVRLALGQGPPRVAASAKTGGRIRAIALSADGKLVYAALSDIGQVVAMDAALLGEVRRLDVPVEPWGVLPSPNGSSLYVADFDGNRVLCVDAKSGKTEFASTPVCRPSCLAMAPKTGEVHAVSFRTGEVVVLDGECRVVRRAAAPKQLNQCRSICFGPDGTLYAPQTRSDTVVGGHMFDRSVFPAVALLRPRSDTVAIGLFPDLLVVPPHRPVDAAVDRDTLYLVSAGSDDVLAIDLRTEAPKWHAQAVGLEPGGIALDRSRNRLYVLTVTGQEIVTLDPATGDVISRVRLAQDPTPRRIARGRYLFGTATDPRLTKDQWMSCAVCHPDGDEDGRQWDLGQGRLDTHSLRGSVRCAPLHYTAHLDEIQDTMGFTRNVMAGRWFVEPHRMRESLGASNAGLDDDLDALAAYIASLAPKRSPSPPPASLRAIGKGRALFFSDKTGCVTCHPPPRYTDSGAKDAQGRFFRHDVGTWRASEHESLRRLDTPSLLGLRQSEPYLHDGRAPTIESVLRECNPHDRHGRTAHLTDAEIRALAEFLRYLAPDEKPAAREIGRGAERPR